LSFDAANIASFSEINKKMEKNIQIDFILEQLYKNQVEQHFADTNIENYPKWTTISIYKSKKFPFLGIF